jgi:cytochrome c556
VRRGQSWISVASLVMAITAGSSSAQDQGDQVIQNRIASFREIGTAYKHIGDELKKRTPDSLRIQESAQVIKHRGTTMLSWFPPRSEPRTQAPTTLLDRILGWFSSNEGVSLPDEDKSHAKPVIWTQRREFEEDHSKFMAEADRMQQVAEGGELAAISGQFKKLGQTCESCHERFRERLD